MTSNTPLQTAARPRILVVDDNADIRADFAKILQGERAATPGLAAAEALFFGDAPSEHAAAARPCSFDVEFASQGEEGFQKLVGAGDARFALAFVDMRMPPGWDGLQTIERMLARDDQLQVVLCTAFSDTSMDEVRRRLGPTDRWILLKKPFDPAEVEQLALALTAKWNGLREVEQRLHDLESLSAELTTLNAEMKLEIGRREHAERRLLHQLHFDAVTGLPNRLRLAQIVDKLLKKPASASVTGVALVSLGGLHRIREALGHAAADEAVRLASVRLGSLSTRPEVAAACERSIVTRVGPDELVLVLDGLRSADGGLAVADAVITALAEPFTLEGRSLALEPCVGVASSRLHYDGADDFLRDAMTAAHAARSGGAPRRAIFEPRLHMQARSRIGVESNLRRALDEGQIVLVYQPVVSVEDQRVAGIHAYIHWNHPHADAPAPSTYLPVAEECGLAPRLGLELLAGLLRDAASWTPARNPRSSFVVELPVLPAALADETFARALVEAVETLATGGLALALVLDERALASQSPAFDERLRALRAGGARLHVELRGEPHSLSLLQRWKPERVRVADAVMNDVEDEPSLLDALRAYVDHAKRLGLGATADGVETEARELLARELGVDALQGRHVAGLESPAALAARLAASGAKRSDGGR